MTCWNASDCSIKFADLSIRNHIDIRLLRRCADIARAVVGAGIRTPVGICSNRDYGKLAGEEWSERRDSNPRPLDPQSSALPGCATLRPCFRESLHSLTASPWERKRRDGRFSWKETMACLPQPCKNRGLVSILAASSWRQNAAVDGERLINHLVQRVAFLAGLCSLRVTLCLDWIDKGCKCGGEFVRVV